jgi:hypothetical protein
LTLETLEYATKPQTNGESPLPKRSGPKGLLPSTWLNRSLRVQYTDSSGAGCETTGTLLDLYPAGPVLSMNGTKAILSWDALVLCELVPD